MKLIVNKTIFLKLSTLILLTCLISFPAFSKLSKKDIDKKKQQILSKYSPSHKTKKRNQEILSKYNVKKLYGNRGKSKKKRMQRKRNKKRNYSTGLKKIAESRYKSNSKIRRRTASTFKEQTTTKEISSENTIQKVSLEKEENVNNYSVLKKGQINHKDTNLFEVITRRYILSGFKRLKR